MTAAVPVKPPAGNTDVEPVRQHLHLLRAARIGPREISRITNVPEPTIDDILYRPGRHVVRATTAARILAVDPDRHHMIDAIGTRRRLMALGTEGYDSAATGPEVGMPAAAVERWLRYARIHAAHAAAVTDLYQRWAGTRAEDNGVSAVRAERARARALRRRWYPPSCWAGEDMDDPEAAPVSPRTTWRSEDLVAEAERVRAALTDHTWPEIAAHLGVSFRALDRARTRVAARRRSAP